MRTYHLFTSVLAVCLFSFCLACNTASTTKDNNTQTTPTVKLPTILQKALTAHGGLDQWNKMQTLEYTVQRNDKPERHQIDLKTRKVLLTHEDYKLGFDGKEVWVTPNKAAFSEKSSPRFYHNLIFYFHAFPYVMADPGINYEVLPQKEMNGKMYDAIKISYNAGVGDAPDDYYIAHFDAETHQMYLLLYTVTYFNGKPGDKFNALVYDDWVKINGLLVPQSMKGFKYADGELGEQRYERPFADIQLRETALNQVIFEMPKGAEIDSLMVH